LLDVNPFFWLSSRDRRKPLYVWSWLALTTLLWLGLFLKNRRSMIDPVVFFMTAFLLHFWIKVWVASEAGKQISQDKRTGALELLVSTPLTTRQILEGQFLALVRQFGWPILAILALDFIMMLHGARDGGGRGSDSEWVMICLAMIIIFIADLFVLATVSMWLGLIGKRSSRAFTKTLFYILAIPWILFFAFLTLVSLTVSGMAGDSGGGLIGAWFVISALVDVFLYAWASGNLSSKFREIVTQRFDPVPP
jgi:hypothetical protein